MLRRGRMLLLLWAILLSVNARAGSDGAAPDQVGQPVDACWQLLGQPSARLGEMLTVPFMSRFPVTAQLAEGNARLSALTLRLIDCEQQRVVVSSAYEFRGNIGVMDLTRRGTAVIQLQLTPDPAPNQVWLGAPEVLDITFDNPAPWFDGKAIHNWALELFATPLCVSLQHGQPC